LQTVDGRALPMQICVERNGRPTLIQSRFYPGEPSMYALDRLFGFPSGSCKSSYDLSSGGSSITYEGTIAGNAFLFMGRIYGPPGALSLSGGVVGAIPVTPFDTGSSK